jgi:hypothetical protein
MTSYNGAIGPIEEKIDFNPSLEDRVHNLEYNLRFLMDVLCKMFPLNNELEMKLREAMDRGGGIQNFPPNFEFKSNLKE